MPGSGDINPRAGQRGLMKSTALQVVSAVVATTVIAILGIDRVPALLPWGDGSSSTSVVAAQEMSTSNATTDPPTTSTSPEPSPTTTTAKPTRTSTTKPTAASVLATAKFSNDLLAAAETDGRSTWSTIPLNMSALKDGTTHDNAENARISTATNPSACKWEQDSLFFMASGLCVVKVTIPKARKNARYESLEKTYRIDVRPPVISSPETYSPHERVSNVATARSNFLTYGREVPTELTFGDVLGYWHMKLRIAMKQPDPALGPARCYRVYARYQYGSKQSYNDFTEDQLGCQELSGTTAAKDFCVNFQPSWYKLTTTTSEPIGIVDASGAPLQDKYARVKFARIGWGIEWGWETYNSTQVTPDRTLTTAEKAMVQSETHRPSVEVLKIAAGKCS